MSAHQTTLEKKIASLQTLEVQPGIAIRMIELGKSAEAELDDYIELVRLCPALASKLLAFANSSWYSPRQPITTVQLALAMIGTVQVRALAVSFCLAGMLDRFDLDAEDAQAYWDASLFKAVAAKQLAAVGDEKCADEAFAIGLLQDMGLILLVCGSDNDYATLLQDPTFQLAEQLEYEDRWFGMDHAAVSARIARSFGLPDIYQSCIAAQHQQGNEKTASNNDCVRLSSSAAACLPHDMRCWKPRDLGVFAGVLSRDFKSHWQSPSAFVTDVQGEFDALSQRLGRGPVEPADLTKLMQQVCMENLTHVSRLVGEVESANNENQQVTSFVDTIVNQQVTAEFRADHDGLTGALNRTGFLKRLNGLLPQLVAKKQPLGVVFFDCDRFKQVNDEHGHDAGDEVLKTIVARMQSAIANDDLICRWGGDEIVLAFIGRDVESVTGAVQGIQGAIGDEPVVWEQVALRPSVTAGLAWSGAGDWTALIIDQLIRDADKNLYRAKQTRRGSLHATAVNADPTRRAG